jgi:hypothetical protein
MSLMMASPGARFVTREEAFRTDILPARTRTYHPVTNEELVTMANKVAEEHGLTLLNEELGMNKKKTQMFAMYEVEGKDFFDNQIKMMLGLINSYDGTLSAKTLFGSKVDICSNLSFWANTGENGIGSIVSRKHTNNVFSEGNGLWYRLNKSLEQIDTFCREQERFCEQLREEDLSKEKAYSTIVKSARAGVIGKTNILDVADIWDYQTEKYPDNEQEYKNEWHEEFRRKDCYSLFNCFTESNKSRIEKNPIAASLDTLKLTDFFNKEFALN